MMQPYLMREVRPAGTGTEFLTELRAGGAGAGQPVVVRRGADDVRDGAEPAAGHVAVPNHLLALPGAGRGPQDQERAHQCRAHHAPSQVGGVLVLRDDQNHL